MVQQQASIIPEVEKFKLNFQIQQLWSKRSMRAHIVSHALSDLRNHFFVVVMATRHIRHTPATIPLGQTGGFLERVLPLRKEMYTATEI